MIIIVTLFLTPSAFAQDGPRNTLAVTWQPGFCAVMSRLSECQTDIRANGFTLHGLWPSPRGNIYCDVPAEIEELDRRGAWMKLDPVPLPKELEERLSKAMPGVASGLDRHEWIKHGTCYDPATPTQYYQDSLTLLDTLNQSGIADLFEEAAGSRLDEDTIRTAFDLAFGPGAGERVQIVCREAGPTPLIVELRINLEGHVQDNTLTNLISDAAPRRSDCKWGIVEEALN